MKLPALTYIVSGIAFLGLDFVWLSVMGPALYRPQLGNLLLEKFLVAPAILFYLVYPIGITVFAVFPALQSSSAVTAFCYGLLLGFLAYSTYNLTNMAILRGWSPLVTIADMCWGAIATGSAAAIGFWIVRLLTRP